MENKTILGFFGKYRWLSNFWSCQVFYEDQFYPSVENAFQAAKTLDQHARDMFLTCPPDQAKKLGRKLVLRDDWEEIKISIMCDLLRIKFQDPELARFLLDTEGSKLEESNNWGDTFWGICYGVGDNHLGKCLMTVREELLSSQEENMFKPDHRNLSLKIRDISFRFNQTGDDQLASARSSTYFLEVRGFMKLPDLNSSDEIISDFLFNPFSHDHLVFSNIRQMGGSSIALNQEDMRAIGLLVKSKIITYVGEAIEDILVGEIKPKLSDLLCNYEPRS